MRDLEQSSIERKPSHMGAAVSHEDAAAVNRAKPLKSPGSADRRDDNKVRSVVGWDGMGWDITFCCFQFKFSISFHRYFSKQHICTHEH
jgi:hypothetical protein